MTSDAKLDNEIIGVILNCNNFRLIGITGAHVCDAIVKNGGDNLRIIAKNHHPTDTHPLPFDEIDSHTIFSAYWFFL
jgi:hypothetical protein